VSEVPLAPQVPRNVDGSELIEQVIEWLTRFVSYPHPHAVTAHAAWILHTHLADCFDNTPRLAFLSPEPGSGKSRALEVTEPLVTDPVLTVNVSVAYLFRRMSVPEGAPLPTILFDEVDSVFSKRPNDSTEELRGLINSGYRRGATVGRAEKTNSGISTADWSSFCPIALAGLNDLPETVMTRTIVVRMRRRRADETVRPYRLRQYREEAEDLRARIAAWADEVRDRVKNKWPELPPSIYDRNADVWEPLFIVADAIGGTWPAIVRQAAVFMVEEASDRPATLGIRLLADIRKVFGDREAMATVNLLGELNEIETAPWGTLLKGEPLDSRALAKYLNKYEIETGNTVRLNGNVFKGYTRRGFMDAWARYLPPEESNEEPVSELF
jgi:hypothetical protein